MCTASQSLNVKNPEITQNFGIGHNTEAILLTKATKDFQI
jgi:hypothetical protein